MKTKTNIKSIVSKRCQKCKYVGVVAFEEPCCDYCYITGTMRGCNAGDKCVRFELKES